MTSSDPLTLSSEVRFCSTAFRRSSLLAIALLLSAVVAPVSFAQGPDSAGSYSIKWYAADPEAGTGPFLPTYIKLPPGALSCPAPSGGLGRASAPLANAQAYAAPAISSNHDAVTSLNPKDMALCQVVPYFVEISVTGSTAPENGVITVNPDWLTKTTSGGNFGFDPAYGLYCAFVDTADPFHVDPGSNAKVDSYGYTITGAGGNNETIAGTIQVSGLDNGDKVVVEAWVVLKCTVPAGASGNVQTSLSSAHTGPSNTSGDNISLGNQTVPLLQVGSFFTVDADVGVTKTASPSVCSGQNITYTVTVTNNSETTVANSIVVTDTLGTGLSFVSSTPAPTSQSGQVLTYNVGALSPGTSTVITILATVTAASGTVTNSVTKTQITADPVTANNSTSVTTTVDELPGCTISGVSSVCPSSSGHVFSAPAGASSYSWSVTGDGSIVGPTDGQTVTISSTSTCNGSFTVAVTATTAAACNSTCSKDVTVVDSTPPSVECPGPVGVQCFSQVPPADIGSVTASDNCGRQVTISHVGDSTSSGTSSCNNVVTRTYRATDACGNTATCTQIITVHDTELPVITLAAAGALTCNPTAAEIEAAFGAASVSDNCSQNLVAQGVVGQESGAGCSFQITKNWTVTDGCGNVGVQSQTVTYTRDTELPVITLAAAGALTCNPTAAEIEAAFGAASVSDNCSQNLIAQGTVIAEEGGAGCSFQTTKNWTVTDGCGNVGVQSQTVSYTRDTELPVITLAAAGALTCNPTAAEIEAAFGVASVSDNCSQNLIAQGTVIAEEGGAGCSFQTTKNWTVTDGCGNVGVQSQTVTYTRDTELPVITLAAAAEGVPCNPTAAQIEAAFGAASVSDNCSQNLIAQGTVIPEEGGAGCSFQTTKNWTVTDGCGNVGVQSQTVTYTRDTELPVITLAAAGTLPCNPTAAEIEAAFGVASVSDDCSQNLVAQGVVGQESGAGCSFQTTKNWTVTDGCGNVGVQSQTVSYTHDTELPVITLAAAGALTCNPTAAEIEAAFGAASVSDNCSQSLIAQGVVGQESGKGCSFQTTKNWTVTDGCGNVGVQSQTVSYTRDTELPVITLAAAGALTCNPTAAEIEAAFGVASVSDDCSQNLVAQGVVGQESGKGCSFQTTKNWTVTDGCGNVGVQSQTVSYTRDTELPVITLAAAGALTCNPTAAEIDAAFGVASVSDDCSQNLVAQGVVGQESGAGCSFQTTKNWTVTDGCGNVGVQSQTVTYTRDTELPVITLAAAGALTCNPTAAEIEAAFGVASVSDNCSQNLIAQGVVGQESGAGCSFQTTKNWTVTDGCGNVGVQSQTVTYTRDTELPVITLAAAGALTCNPTAAEIEAAFGVASVSDDCSQNLIAQGVVGQESGAGCSFQTTKNWTVTDGCGNVGVQSQTVSYTRDTELPVITLAAAGALTCNPTAAEIEAAFGVASVSDNCSQNLIAQGVVGQESGSGWSFQTTKNWTVTDGCGNIGVQSQTVTYTRDTELPVITLAAAGALTCNPTAAEIEAAFGVASVSDNCSLNLIAQGVVGQESGAGCSFQTTKNWSVTDNCGNIGVQSQTVTYTRDTELPVITLAAAGALTCNPTAAEIEAAFGVASVSDNCSQNLVAQGVVGQESGQGCSFQTTKNWSVTDNCGNVGVQSQTVTYTRDTELPVITLAAAGALTCNPTAAEIEAAFGVASVSDNCSQNLVAQGVVGQESGKGCSFQTTKNWTVTDGCGNVGVESQTVTYTRDTELPVITLAAAGALTCNPTAAEIEAAFGVASVSDDCSQNLVAQGVVGQESGKGCSFQTTKNWTVTDGCGNVGVQSQTVSYTRDTTAPVFDPLPAPSTIECGNAPVFAPAFATDACDTAVTLTSSDSSVPSGICTVVWTRTWTATDDCGNSQTATQTISVTDSTPPTLVCAGPGTVECPSPAVFTDPTVSDACDANPVVTFTTGEPVPGSCPQSYSVTRTWTATDVCGNGASCSQTITIVDTTPPVISCPPPFTVPCGTSTAPAITGTATSVDACDPMPSMTPSDVQVGSCPQGGQIERTWTSTDHCGNSSSCVQIITLTMNPGADCEPGFVADLGGECGAPAPYLTSTPPVIGKYLDVRVIGGTPNSPLVIAAQGPTFPPATPLGGPCVLWIDPNLSLLINDVTDANGEYQILALLTDPGLLNVEFRIQGAVLTNGGPLGVVQLMNGLLLHFGSCPPFCTAVRESFGGAGYAGQVFDLNYQAVFPNGLEIGQFDLPSGNLSPNGLRWDPTATGQAALKTFLGGAGGASSELSSDLINPTVPPGGGQLALQTAALAINVGFNNANVMGSLTPGFASQVYWNFPGVPDSLNGLNITQILAVANTALAGLGLPPGYTMTTLTQHISEINLGYDGCNSTRWASLFLHHPVQ